LHIGAEAVTVAGVIALVALAATVASLGYLHLAPTGSRRSATPSASTASRRSGRLPRCDDRIRVAGAALAVGSTARPARTRAQ